jgi:hypothetical protein
MAERVFFLNTLKEGVDPTEYEGWVRRVDYPIARALPAIESYEVTRLEGTIGEGDLPAQYLEVIEVTSVEEYRAGLTGSPDIDRLFEEWSTYVGESLAVHGQVI